MSRVVEGRNGKGEVLVPGQVRACLFTDVVHAFLFGKLHE